VSNLVFTVMILVGAVAFLTAAIAFRAKNSPCPTSGRDIWRHWLTPIWRQQGWFTPFGYWLSVTGLTTMVAGAFLRVFLG